MNLKGYDLAHLAEFLTELRAAEEAHGIQLELADIPLSLRYDGQRTGLELVRGNDGDLCARAES